MSQIPQQGGASVHARGRIPSTDLASLINFLVKAFPTDENRSDHPLGWPVLTFDPVKKRLGINTYGILRRFLAQKEMRDAFRQSETTGFLCDLVSPPKNFTAKMGGRIFNDNIAGLSQNITKLKRLIADEIDRLGITSENILVSDPASALQELAHLTGIKHFFEALPAKLVAMEFAKTERPASLREKDVARVLSALEEIQAEDWLERMTSSIANTQSHRDDEFDEIQRDKLTETLRQDFDKNDSQVTRFLNFLEDEALSRVRLSVSFAIMKGLGVQVAKSEKATDKAFVNYVQSVVDLFAHYGAPESPHSMHLNLSRDYGLAADFSVSQELVKAMFYNCLPVWSEWNTQLFESRRVDPISRGVSVVREVSYRFRVNGKDPRNEMFPAFDSRLMRLREVLLDNSGEEQSSSRLRRGLSEVVFLWLVLNPAINSSNLPEEAEKLIAKLNTEGKPQVEMLLQDLSSWNERVKGLSKTLVDLLRTKSRTVIAHAQRSIDDLYMVVQQGVVDWSAIERSKGKARDPLVKPTQGQNENVEWFKHIKIAKKPDDVLAPLFSVRVKTALNERTLAMRENGMATTRIVRQAPEKLLNITWMPIRVDEKQTPVKAKPRAEINPVWRMGSGVDIWYEPEQLKQRDNPKYTDEDRRQYRAAAASALTILVYVVLQILTEKLTREHGESLPALMLRFQTQGKKASEKEGDHLVYAASQAIESALMRDTPVRMQGLVTDGNRYYKDKGAAFALSAAFPLVVGTGNKPTIDKIAAVVYSTRPCDDHPDLYESAGFIFRAKTYLADAVNEPLGGYRLAFDRMQSHVVETSDEFKSPKLIVEEVSRLQGMSYEHIILISSHFGNRRINRSAERHSPHTQTAFLDEVAMKFANVSLYMLRRDVFPATRLHTRMPSESAFEAVRISDHDEFAIDHGDGILKQLIPVFTFATLSIVGNDDASRPQSGFCTYFWDADYQVRDTEWRERVRFNILGSGNGTRDCLLNVLRGLHFLEAEKQPEAGVFKPVLDPFGWMQPSSTGSAGEIVVIPASRRKGNVLLSLPAVLSHVTEALHSGRA
ncbi:MAG: hypothetical protein HOP36_12190 [Methyloglobulus sp.]|nr:hypothetical protein [Methyloglobulus sp.]